LAPTAVVMAESTGQGSGPGVRPVFTEANDADRARRIERYGPCPRGEAPAVRW